MLAPGLWPQPMCPFNVSPSWKGPSIAHCKHQRAHPFLCAGLEHMQTLAQILEEQREEQEAAAAKAAAKKQAASAAKPAGPGTEEKARLKVGTQRGGLHPDGLFLMVGIGSTRLSARQQGADADDR